MARTKTIRGMAAILAVCLGGPWSGAALAQTDATCTASFACDPDADLPAHEVNEPDNPTHWLLTEHTRGAFNKLAFVLTNSGRICAGGGGGPGRGGGGGGAGNNSKDGSGHKGPLD